MKKIFLGGLLLFFFLQNGFTQEAWNLDGCIEYALENNLDIKTSNVRIEEAEARAKIAKTDIIQSIDITGSQSYNTGRSFDYLTNSFLTNNSKGNNFSGNIGLNFSLPYWLNRKLKEMEIKSQQIGLKLTEREIKIVVAGYFLQVILAKEILSIAEKKLEYSENLKVKTLEMEKAGERTRSDVLEIDAQIAIEKSDIVRAQNDVRYKIIVLEQAMNYTGERLEVVTPEEVNLPASSFIFVEPNIENYPGILLADENIRIQEQNLKISKALSLPSLSLNNLIRTGYSSNRAIGTERPNFSSQLDQNLQQSVNFTLRIPILDNINRKRNIRLYQTAIDLAKVEKEKREKELKNELEQLKTDIENNIELHAAYSRSLEANKLSYEFMQSKYEAGRATLTELNQIKTNVYETESNLARYKYSYYYKLKILSFYE